MIEGVSTDYVITVRRRGVATPQPGMVHRRTCRHARTGGGYTADQVSTMLIQLRNPHWRYRLVDGEQVLRWLYLCGTCKPTIT